MERSSDAALVAPCVAFVTLGCAKNEADTARMRVRLAEAGFLIEVDPAEADAVVVNTCSFIQSATEESIEAVFDAAGMPNVAAGAPLIVAGCMPARYGEDLADELVEARAFVPCSREDDIAAIVADALGVDAPGGGAAASVTLSASGGAAEVEGSRAALAALPAAPFAYVKISDGCDRFCTYCTIPYIRGRYRSFPLDDVRADVAAQVAAGAREIVLIAQDTGRWGADFDEPSSLAALVAALAEEFPQTWFRIMYIQPEGLSDELLDAVAAHDNVCDYFDIPLQHVDAGILRAMNRTGSREEGTRAFDLPGQLDEDEKNDRAQRLRDLADAVCCPRIAARVGREMDVLVEGVEEDGQLFGRAMCQAPEVDGVTYLDAGEPGEIRRVRIVDALLYEMEGE